MTIDIPGQAPVVVRSGGAPAPAVPAVPALTPREVVERAGDPFTVGSSR